jgi:hypothetical protein
MFHVEQFGVNAWGLIASEIQVAEFVGSKVFHVERLLWAKLGTVAQGSPSQKTLGLRDTCFPDQKPSIPG